MIDVQVWKRIRDYAAKQVAKQAGAALKCPCCNRWTYEYDGWSFSDEPNEPISRLFCGECATTSRWLEGPALILLDWSRSESQRRAPKDDGDRPQDEPPPSPIPSRGGETP